MTSKATVPVLIAGAGPVGITLAMDLARLGVDSIVLEARREVPPNPRCNTTNARSMELLLTRYHRSTTSASTCEKVGGSAER